MTSKLILPIGEYEGIEAISCFGKLAEQLNIVMAGMWTFVDATPVTRWHRQRLASALAAIRWVLEAAVDDRLDIEETGSVLDVMSRAFPTEFLNGTVEMFVSTDSPGSRYIVTIDKNTPWASLTPRYCFELNLREMIATVGVDS